MNDSGAPRNSLKPENTKERERLVVNRTKSMKDQTCKGYSMNGPEGNARESGCFTSIWLDTRDYLESRYNVQVKMRRS